LQIPWTLAGFPTLSLAAGLSQDGLPLAMHLIAGRHQEPVLLAARKTWVPQLSVRLVTEKWALTCGNAKEPSDGACH
jgi:Asp-tRNA(Asn)/Glu-tRNA(Gln) amidotransferase A subunit family amidase